MNNTANDLRLFLGISYRKNPYFDISFKEFLSNISKIQKEYEGNLKNYIDNLKENSNFNTFYNCIIKDLSMYFIEKFKDKLPSSSIESIVYCLILFNIMEFKNKEMNEYRKSVLKNIIIVGSFIKDEESNDFNKYDTGVLSGLIFDIIKLNQGCLLNIFLGKLFLMQHFSESDIHELYVNKKSINEKITYEGLNDFYIVQNQKYNRSSDETKIDNACLSYVFEQLVDSKIKFWIKVIRDNPNEVYVSIDEEKIEILLQKLNNLFDPLFLIEAFLTLKLEDKKN